MGERYDTTEGYSIIAVSNWLPMTADGTFVFNDRTYSLEDFWSAVWPTMFYDSDGKLHHLSGWQRDEWKHPLAIEFEDGMEWCRLFKEE